MDPTRRQFLTACAGAVPALACLAADEPPKAETRATSLGVVEHSYTNRLAASRAGEGRGRLADPLEFLEFCHERGAGGIQIVIGARDISYCEALGSKAESYAMSLEGSIRLPSNKTHLAAFSEQLDSAERAGVQVLRTAILSGRRYETFDSAATFASFADHALQSLLLAKDKLQGRFTRLAVENHKDWRAGELVRLLERVDSENIGACVDTGNNIALLEDPMEVVETLAPWAFTTHLKDMAVEEYDQGFLLSEVPLGEGFLDLKRIVRVLRAARPEIRFNLEMITRDPLKVPYLSPKYWATFPDLPGRDLVRALALIRAKASKRPLPRVSPLPPDERLKAEDDNVRRCLAYAREHLGL
jgi:3-oxoisoapionate decarboxylase